MQSITTFYADGFKKLSGQDIVSFERIPEYSGGHIDVLDARSWVCQRSCYFSADQIWFWTLR